MNMVILWSVSNGSLAWQQTDTNDVMKRGYEFIC